MVSLGRGNVMRRSRTLLPLVQAISLRSAGFHPALAGAVFSVLAFAPLVMPGTSERNLLLSITAPMVPSSGEALRVGGT